LEERKKVCKFAIMLLECIKAKIKLRYG